MSARSSPTRFWEIFRCMQWPPGPRCSGRLEHAWCSGQRSERERRSGCVAVLDSAGSAGQWMRSGCAVDRGQRGAAVHGVAEQRRGYLWSRGVAGEVAVGAELFRAAHRAATAEHRGGAGVVRRKTIQIHLSLPSSFPPLSLPPLEEEGGGGGAGPRELDLYCFPPLRRSGSGCLGGKHTPRLLRKRWIGTRWSNPLWNS